MSNPVLDELPEKDTWETPQWIIDGITDHVDIDLDPCAGPDTDVAETNWSIQRGEDGLEQSWRRLDGQFETVFVNPPFSDKSEWIDKAAREYGIGNVRRGFIVTPDSTDVKSWFHGTGEKFGITDFASHVWFAEGRVSYIDPQTGETAGSPSFGTAISMFGPMPDDLLRWFDEHGWVVKEARI